MKMYDIRDPVNNFLISFGLSCIFIKYLLQLKDDRYNALNMLFIGR